ncbi:CDP-glycerol glycerophosphotransferase family protein [Myxococcota bacterium]|nr:CDP-glycerol glycerophosphotransferase family protein [Myxococcota bacterium]
MIVRLPETPGTRAAVAPVMAELGRAGHLVVTDGPCDVALCGTVADALALRRAGVGPVAYLPQRSNPGRGWGAELKGAAAAVDLVCLPGPVYVDVLHVVAPEVRHFVVTGLPRADALRAAPDARARVIAAHGLDPARPLVVFAPRWHQRVALSPRRARGHGTLPWLTDVVEAVAAVGAQLIVLPHPREHRSRRLALAPVVARVTDATPYLCAADVLVSDFSPVVAEFAVRDRPIIQLVDAIAPRVHRLTGPANPRSHELFDVGEQVVARGLGGALTAALSGADPAAAGRRAWVERLFAYPGEAARRVVVALESLAGLTSAAK